MKYNFRKRLSDTRIEPGTLSMSYALRYRANDVKLLENFAMLSDSQSEYSIYS